MAGTGGGGGGEEGAGEGGGEEGAGEGGGASLGGNKRHACYPAISLNFRTTYLILSFGIIIH